MGRSSDAPASARETEGHGAVLGNVEPGFSDGASFHRVFESAPFGMALRGATGDYREVNDVYAQIFGRSAAEISGCPGSAFLHPDDSVSDKVIFQKLVTGQVDGFRIQRRVLRPGGEIRWVSVTLTALAGIPVLEMVEDVTEVRRSREEIREREAALTHATRLATLGEMAAGIAHEVNQPLAAIVNYANGSLRRLASAEADLESVKQAIGYIAREAMRASEIVRRLKRLSRREDGERERVDLNAALRATTDLLETEFGDLRIELCFDLAAEIPDVLIDPVQIEQVVLNLLRNAIEALRVWDGSRRITLSTAIDGEQVCISVADTGPGLEPLLVDKVFDAFFTTKRTGLGMGLSISRTIVENHRGRLWVQPNSPTGAVFCLALPIFGEVL